MSIGRRLAVGFSVAVILLFAFAFVVSLNYQPRARHFPLATAAAGVIFGSFAFWQERRGEGGQSIETSSDVGTLTGDNEKDRKAIGRLFRYFGWVVALMALVATVGMEIAATLFVASFLRFEGQMELWRAAAFGVGVSVLLVVIADGMVLSWPSSLIGFR